MNYTEQSCSHSPSRNDLFKDCTKTVLLCSMLLAANTPPNIEAGNANSSFYRGVQGSDSFRIGQLISSRNETWSPITLCDYESSKSFDNISASVKLLKNLSFLEGDLQAEKEADAYFDNIPVKTRKVLILNKS